MFLFILDLSFSTMFWVTFKYISCSYLSQILCKIIHSVTLFKYISCSYLSRWEFQCLRMQWSLNTSHVLIYLWNALAPFAINVGFKYISCSYLSHVFKPFFNSIYPFFPLNSSISQNFTNRLSFFG